MVGGMKERRGETSKRTSGKANSGRGRGERAREERGGPRQETKRGREVREERDVGGERRSSLRVSLSSITVLNTDSRGSLLSDHCWISVWFRFYIQTLKTQICLQTYLQNVHQHNGFIMPHSPQ